MRLQRAGALALLLLSLGLLLARTGARDVPFLLQTEEAPWLAPPTTRS